jgi:putative transposase
MPLRARMYLPEQSYHIVQRGNNRAQCFIESEDYKYDMVLWKEILKRYELLVHSHCPMTIYIRFPVTPTTNKSISNVMKVVGSRNAQ